MNFHAIRLSVISLFVFLMTSGVGMATILNFTIEGTYADSLDDKSGNLLFDVGDSFIIQGQIDDTLQPEVELKTGVHIYQDEYFSDNSLIPFTLSWDYSQIASISYTDLSLSAINALYPCDEYALNSGNLKTGSYLMEFYGKSGDTVIEYQVFQDALNYTSLIIQSIQGAFSSRIDYNYRIETTSQGDFTLVQSLHDTIDLNITTFKIESSGPQTTPEPATIILFAMGLLGVTEMGRRKK